MKKKYYLFAENKKEIMQVLPDGTTDYTYVVYPLQTGYCRLPQLHIKLNNFKAVETDSTPGNDWNNLDPIIQNMIPNQIFIMPHKL